MSDMSPTRMNLLARRSRLSLALRGVDLLQKKRDALVKEFFALVHETLDARKQLDAAAERAHRALLLANSMDGPNAVESVALSVPVVTGFHVRFENVWGTRVPTLDMDWVHEPTISPVSVGGRTVFAQSAFRKLVRAMLRVANNEARLRRFGEEIKKTARRVAALEQVVIPGIRSQMRYIQQVLDQQEQEDIFRLRRIKSKLEAQRSV
jgi:V/A-type H+/Na+-transporting ATPase subunit D